MEIEITGVKINEPDNQLEITYTTDDFIADHFSNGGTLNFYQPGTEFVDPQVWITPPDIDTPVKLSLDGFTGYGKNELGDSDIGDPLEESSADSPTPTPTPEQELGELPEIYDISVDVLMAEDVTTSIDAWDWQDDIVDASEIAGNYKFELELREFFDTEFYYYKNENNNWVIVENTDTDIYQLMHLDHLEETSPVVDSTSDNNLFSTEGASWTYIGTTKVEEQPMDLIIEDFKVCVDVVDVLDNIIKSACASPQVMSEMQIVANLHIEPEPLVSGFSDPNATVTFGPESSKFEFSPGVLDYEKYSIEFAIEFLDGFPEYVFYPEDLEPEDVLAHSEDHNFSKSKVTQVRAYYVDKFGKRANEIDFDVEFTLPPTTVPTTDVEEDSIRVQEQKELDALSFTKVLNDYQKKETLVEFSAAESTTALLFGPGHEEKVVWKRVAEVAITAATLSTPAVFRVILPFTEEESIATPMSGVALGTYTLTREFGSTEVRQLTSSCQVEFILTLLATNGKIVSPTEHLIVNSPNCECLVDEDLSISVTKCRDEYDVDIAGYIMEQESGTKIPIEHSFSVVAEEFASDGEDIELIIANAPRTEVNLNFDDMIVDPAPALYGVEKAPLQLGVPLGGSGIRA